MAITVLKLTPVHCAVMVNTVGTQTISLATDLLWSNATQHEVAGVSTSPGGAPDVRITGLHWAVPSGANITIARNSISNWILPLSNELLFNGWSDTLNSKYDIEVTIPAGGGTVVLELLKYSGYNNSQHLNQLV